MYSLDFADCNIFLDHPLLAHSVESILDLIVLDQSEVDSIAI